MFDVGFWEIFLILILALVVIGPERLPGAARTFGLWVGKTRRFVEGVKGDVEQEFDVSEFKRIIHNQEIQLNELKDKISAPMASLADEVSKQTHDIKEVSSASQEEAAEEELSAKKVTSAAEPKSKNNLAE